MAWKHRIPVRIRHYWKLLAGCAAFVVALTVVFSTVRVQPYVFSSSDASGDEVTQDIAGSIDLFDAGVAHSLKLTFRDADYQRLLDAFYDENEKEYLEADLTVDGTVLSSVGIRLKGNSTLQGLTRDGVSRQGGFGGPGGGARAGAAPGGAAPGGAAPGGAVPGGAVPGGAAPGGGQGRAGGFGRASLAAEKPETLPWLIRFDEFVDGRRYQGHREIAVRVAGMGGGSTVLNEALSLNLLAQAGEVAQRYAYTGFTVNGRPTTARLIVEHPDAEFADRIDGSGVLYKALSTSQFTDQGDDPVDYADDFKQITKKGSQDLQPVIDLVKWVSTSSDADFAQHLADYVDVESFARYAAEQNLLLNFDDMAGPGRNYYLWYDLATKKISVIGWDYNLTFSGNAEQGPHDTNSRGGGGFPGGGFPGGGFPGGADAGAAAPGALPGGGAQAGGAQAGGALPGGAQGGGRFGGNTLKERFLASEAFKPVYEQAYRDVYKKIFGAGQALTAIDDLTKVIATVDGADAQTVASDAEQLRTLVRQRIESLATNEVIAG